MDARKPHTGKQAGFTLVELAVVIALIAMLIGGVLLGRHMVRSSQLSSVLVDKDRYIAAVSQFQQKYNALPGDFREAETYWGTDAGGCPATPYSATKKITTCNGNGNGMLDIWGGSFGEWFRSWQQLSNAGMIQTTYTGTTGSGGGAHMMPGVNVPASRIKGAGFGVRHLGNYAGDTEFYAGDYGHLFYFGAATAGVPVWGAALTTAEANGLDIKADDGLPAMGAIMTWKNTSTTASGCSTTDVIATAAYATATAGIKCSLIFPKVF